MIPRAYAPEVKQSGDLVGLPSEEAVHLRRVLRLRAGDRVRVFNGRGLEFDARFEPSGRAGARVHVGEPHIPAREPRVRVTLVQAILKGDKMDGVIRDATMLGVHTIQPLLATRSDAVRLERARGRRPARWERVAIASAKQCGRATLPVIGPVRGVEEIVAALVAGTLPQPALLMAEPSSTEGGVLLESLREVPKAVTVLVGPEGGWEAGELRALQAVACSVTLGNLTLRADAAPLVILAALLARWEAW